MPTIEVPNIGTFTVNGWNEGSGSPLLFLHGYERHPGGASFLQELAKTHTVYAPEQPGYGSSTGFEHIQDVFDLVLFYREYVASLGVDKIDVIGHSSGGMIAAELAALNPQLVGKLVLVDAFGVWVEKSMYGRKYMGIDRATFLLDEAGRIARSWRKVKVPGHARAVLDAVRAMSTADA